MHKVHNTASRIRGVVIGRILDVRAFERDVSDQYSVNWLCKVVEALERIDCDV